jgi:predicted porin
MKKLLLATLLASAGLGVAQAQSSVTIYGLLDVGYIGTNYKGIGTEATSKQQTSAFGNNGESNSRLGFRGQEDLGGGTSAIFTVETGLNPSNSTMSTFNNRQSFVGLKQNGLGQVAVGTQYTPIHTAVGATSANQQNNMVGDVIYASNPQLNGNSGSSTFSNSTSSAGTSDAYTVRVSNSVKAISDNFKGFTGTGFVTANNTNSTQTSATTGGDNNYSGWGLGVNYEWKKLLVTANYQALKSVVPGTLTSPTPALWTTASGGVNTQDNQTYAAATYDFGILKAYAQWINRKATSTINSGYFASRTAQQIGVRGNFTANVDAWASVGNGRVDGFGSSIPSANFVGYQLGSNYYLSKRTNLYAIYGQSNTSSTSVLPALSANTYALGMRHTF